LLEGDVMLELDRVSKVYRAGAFGGRQVMAVREVSLSVDAGEVVSLIGESGSGKSTIGRMVLRLAKPTRGSIRFAGREVTAIKGRDYWRDVQGVFQDPFSSFNPVFKATHVFDLIRDSYFRSTASVAWESKIDNALHDVSLEPAQIRGKYPHQLSGGQLQRLLIARALLLDIKLLVADEIISMLDASTRIDILNLLGELKSRGLGILFITHDLTLADYLGDRTVILRRGEIAGPQDPYTQTLLDAVPQLHRKWD
jgi:peptide/nickel transport system ATP-binding protein